MSDVLHMDLLERVWPYVPLLTGRVIAAAAMLAASYVVGTVIRALIQRIGLRDPLRREVCKLLAQGAYAALLLVGLVTALGTLGVDVTAMVAGLGLTGFALGFALKDMLSNTVAGLMILLSRPFVIGDRIAVAGYEGIIEQINLRYTLLRDEEKRFLIPNSTVLNSPVTVMPPKAAGPAGAPQRET